MDKSVGAVDAEDSADSTPPGELVFETVEVLSVRVIVAIDPDPFDVGVTRRE